MLTSFDVMSQNDLGIFQNKKVTDITHEIIWTGGISDKGDSICNLSVTVFVIDTTNTSKVKISIGTSENNSNIYSGTYNWEQNILNGSFDCEFSRQGIELYLVLKDVPYSDYYFSASTIDKGGKEDNVYTKHRN